MFVPQQEAWIVERMGKFNRILDPGLNVLMPFIDRVKYVQSLKEIAIDVPKQSAITVDNVTLGIDGVLYLRILDPYLGKWHGNIIFQLNTDFSGYFYASSPKVLSLGSYF